MLISRPKVCVLSWLAHLIARSAPFWNPTIAYLLPGCCKHIPKYIPGHISRKMKPSANFYIIDLRKRIHIIPGYISRKDKSHTKTIPYPDIYLESISLLPFFYIMMTQKTYHLNAYHTRAHTSVRWSSVVNRFGFVMPGQSLRSINMEVKPSSRAD